MMPIFLKGVLLGFSLSFLIGPLLFTLVQAAIERGQKAGLAVAAGIWASDLFFVFAVLFFVEKIQNFTAGPGFSKWAGLVGGLLLIGFGLVNFIKKKVAGLPAAEGFQPETPSACEGLRPETPLARESLRPETPHLGAHFTKGFLINSINPFTVFFWLGITGTVIVPNRWGAGETLIFFAGMLGTLVATDVLKVFLCKKIAHWLTAAHVKNVRIFIGFGLVIFGIVLIIRTL